MRKRSPKARRVSCSHAASILFRARRRHNSSFRRCAWGYTGGDERRLCEQERMLLSDTAVLAAGWPGRRNGRSVALAFPCRPHLSAKVSEKPGSLQDTAFVLSIFIAIPGRRCKCFFGCFLRVGFCAAVVHVLLGRRVREATLARRRDSASLRPGMAYGPEGRPLGLGRKSIREAAPEASRYFPGVQP